ncbi:zinc finger and BTB domain-containing protein 5 [Grus japonensis]|uniref:Zinc finger and BTB domain-containing protein 5 n=1 Tax=Grus japonensis TaxID=30415 RepID=A0ABC9Y698_GRUJA
MEDPTPAQVEAPEGGCDPVGSPRWSKLLAGPVAPWREEPTPEQVCWQDLGPHGGPMLEQSVPEGLHPVGETHAGAVGEELQPVGRTHVGEVGGGLSSVGGTPGWSRGRV